MITARNYASQARVGLLEWAARSRAASEKTGEKLLFDDAAHVEKFANEIEKAVHFALPDYGRILDDKLRGIDGETFRLPYPSITVEFFCDDKVSAEYPVSMTKRVALASEVEVGGKLFIDIFVANYGREVKVWTPQAIGVRIDPNDPISTSRSGLELTMSPMILSKVILDEMTRAFGADAMKNAFHDITDEITAVFELVEALTCSNVKTSILEPVDPAKQARRARDGKLPIYETKILTIPGSGGGRELGGTHSGPRQHLRRGHIRRLPGGNVWVNSHLVGDPTKGRIEKQYQVDNSKKQFYSEAV
jgi:hypothetical protein